MKRTPKAPPKATAAKPPENAATPPKFKHAPTGQYKPPPGAGVTATPKKTAPAATKAKRSTGEPM
jgi:hypothetical protein